MGAGSSRPVSRFHLTAQEAVNECGNGSTVKRLNILVTGATSGIGIETARVLACNGAKVYLMGRDQSKVHQVVQNISNELQQQQQQQYPSGGSIHGVICDLNSLASIKHFAQEFINEKTRLNVLILNAGVFNSNFAQTVDGLEQTMGVNHIGQAYLTKLLIPTLVANAPSRVVIVSSKVHDGPPIDYHAFDRMNRTAKNAKHGWSMIRSYQQSKLANLLFARALSSRYKDKQVTAYSLHPGAMRTNLGRNIPLSGVTMLFFKEKTMAEGAATSVFCAVKPGLESDTGRYFDDSTVTDVADKWTDDDVNRLWDWTEKIIGDRTTHL